MTARGQAHVKAPDHIEQGLLDDWSVAGLAIQSSGRHPEPEDPPRWPGRFRRHFSEGGKACRDGVVVPA